MFEFIELEGDSLLSTSAYKMAVTVVGYEMILKCWLGIESYFQVWDKRNVLL